jgi:hypothetical protein
MKNITSKTLLVLFATSIIGISLTKINAQVTNSKLQKAVQPSQQSSKLAEKIEGLNIIKAEGSIIAPRTFEEMVNTSDLIVIGRPSQSVAESTALVKKDSEGYINEAISQTEFKVSQVLKGSISSKKILIGQLAAIAKDKNDVAYAMMVVDEYRPLVKNAKYILFLQKGMGGSPLYFSSGVYFGKINLDGNDQGEKKAGFAQDVRVIQAAALKRYQTEVSQPD